MNGKVRNMAASPLITAWAGLRPSHFKVGPGAVASPGVALKLALPKLPRDSCPGPVAGSGPSLARFDSTYWTLLQNRSRDPLLPQGLTEKSDRWQLVRQ